MGYKRNSDKQDSTSNSLQLIYYKNFLSDEPTCVNVANLLSIEPERDGTRIYLIGGTADIFVNTHIEILLREIEKGFNVLYCYKGFVTNKLADYNRYLEIVENSRPHTEANIGGSIKSFYEFSNTPYIRDLQNHKKEKLYKDYIKGAIEADIWDDKRLRINDVGDIEIDIGDDIRPRELRINNVVIPPGYTLEKIVVQFTGDGEHLITTYTAERFIERYGCLPENYFIKYPHIKEKLDFKYEGKDKTADRIEREKELAGITTSKTEEKTDEWYENLTQEDLDKKRDKILGEAEVENKWETLFYEKAERTKKSKKKKRERTHKRKH